MSYKDFPILPVNPASIGNRKLVCGIGVNDANYQTNVKIDGVVIRCPIYEKWVSLLKRCYVTSFQANHQSYIGCIVDTRWHSFTSFREWVLAQPEWEGMHLDKDILVVDNKVYGPDTCLFVSSNVNLFFTFRQKTNNGLPVGVSRIGSKYRASVCLNNTNNGRWISARVNTQEEASQLYWAKKLEIANELAAQQLNPIVAKAIVLSIEKYMRQ